MGDGALGPPLRPPPPLLPFRPLRGSHLRFAPRRSLPADFQRRRPSSEKPTNHCPTVFSLSVSRPVAEELQSRFAPLARSLGSRGVSPRPAGDLASDCGPRAPRTHPPRPRPVDPASYGRRGRGTSSGTTGTSCRHGTGSLLRYSGPVRRRSGVPLSRSQGAADPSRYPGSSAAVSPRRASLCA